MNLKTYLNTTLVLTLGGVLFSGYLSFYKLLTGNCALNEPCPFFLGYPACWYGFAMFFVIFDVEALFLYAWAVSVREAGWAGFVVISIFIGELLLGLVYLARIGALDWAPAQRRRRQARQDASHNPHDLHNPSAKPSP